MEMIHADEQHSATALTALHQLLQEPSQASSQESPQEQYSSQNPRHITTDPIKNVHKMIIQTNFLAAAALATLQYAAMPTDAKMPTQAGSPVDVVGFVTCYGGPTWSGTNTTYHVSETTLNTCQGISPACASAFWGIAYKGTKFIKFYSSSSCDGSETYEVHANIQGSDQFQDFKDMHNSAVFLAGSYKVYDKSP
ncbi:hypothetical protein BGZ49_008230 [Haplosporangium sp. Z 27]|nr:hypothetical protein BGZ49_008230 [Haplosporangium sp. Z 27]